MTEVLNSPLDFNDQKHNKEQKDKEYDYISSNHMSLWQLLDCAIMPPTDNLIMVILFLIKIFLIMCLRKSIAGVIAEC